MEGLGNEKKKRGSVLRPEEIYAEQRREHQLAHGDFDGDGENFRRVVEGAREKGEPIQNDVCLVARFDVS